MCDPTGHFPKGAQPFLLQHRFLGLPKIVVRLLKPSEHLYLPDRQGHMLSELMEEHIKLKKELGEL